MEARIRNARITRMLLKPLDGKSVPRGKHVDQNQTCCNASGCVTIVPFWCGSNRIEPTEQKKAGKKAADMRLPCNRLLVTGDGDRTKSEQKVEPEPHGK